LVVLFCLSFGILLMLGRRLRHGKRLALQGRKSVPKKPNALGSGST
jgi:hypothetical protein